MDDFRQTFLADSITDLDFLRKNLTGDFAENRRAAFRTVHTVKGGLQTFGWHNAARLAAEIEGILSGYGEFSDRNLLLESLAQLSEMMRSEKVELSDELLEKLHAAQTQKTENRMVFTRLPPEIYQKLSPSEQKTMLFAIGDKKNIFSAEVCFETSKFAADYRNLRQILEQKCEIIAALPSEKFREAGKIGFQIFLAGEINVREMKLLTKNFAARITLCDYTGTAPNEWLAMLSRVQNYGEKLASAANKKILVSVFSDQSEVSGAVVKNIFDLLLHLIRNAVDHGVAQSGSIEVVIFHQEDGWHISCADDGEGVDLVKLRRRAIEKQIIAGEDALDEQQTLELIFASELSTAENVTETSGLGVGLDAVKTLVEKLNGKISVKSDRSGTVFEIFMPNE